MMDWFFSNATNYFLYQANSLQKIIFCLDWALWEHHQVPVLQGEFNFQYANFYDTYLFTYYYSPIWKKDPFCWCWIFLQSLWKEDIWADTPLSITQPLFGSFAGKWFLAWVSCATLNVCVHLRSSFSPCLFEFFDLRGVIDLWNMLRECLLQGLPWR